LVLSPGPGRPEDAGICVEAVGALAGELPILGVCLGHQAICTAFGSTVGPASRLMHGKRSPTRLDATSALFRGLPPTIEVGRYHSLAVDPATLPAFLHVTATADDGEVMAVEHESLPVFGVQFHPESILTPDGAAIVRNFLQVRWPS
ncbi:MAG: aminodeoxychorismate/anthranilate synthase component II, partial [Atopobiaceae bacterium]